MSTFIHLRVYSDYSFGISNIKFNQLVLTCHDFDMPAIGIADRNMFGTLEFAIKCANSGIQPIIGYSVNIDYSSIIHLIGLNAEIETCAGEVFLLVKSEIGYRNLLQIATCIGVDKQNILPSTIEWSFLIAHSEGLIILLGGVDSSKLLHQIVASEDENIAIKFIQILKQETDLEVFIELTRYKNSSHQESEIKLLKLAYDTNTPIVATNPINFINQQTYESCEALMCIIQNRFMNESDRPRINLNHNFKSQEEMIHIFADLPEAVKNTVLIAQKCHFFPTKQPIRIPKFDLNLDANIVIEEIATAGLNERIKNLHINREQYFARLQFELALIKRMQFSDYFLIVSDFIQWSKSQGIAVGPGRGSGVGSIVAWSLKITELDPIEFGLLFERFLNPERISMPDFDIDFCQLRRDEVLQYIRRKYGEDKIAHIITFGKLQARAVLRDVGRILQMPYGLIDRICKMVPQNQANPLTLQQAINIDKQLQKIRDEDTAIDKLLSISLQIEGCNRNISTHAAGIIIAQTPIVEVMPLYKDPDSGVLSGQFSMKYVEAAGLIKFDFLGLKTLTVISNICELVKHSKNIEIEIYHIPMDDISTYKMLANGNVLGVFQLEGSAGIREAVKQMKPDKFTDIPALTSLYRPGPMENIPTYVARKHGLQAIEVIHPALKDVLNETYGIIVYQEQVIKIAQILAGYSLGEADVLRRAMGKKDKYEMQQQRGVFVSRCIENDLSEQQAENIFDIVNKFASYGFNKAHAVAYALITYQTAYLKSHYFVEFLVASINLEIHLNEKISAFCDESKNNGIEVCKPSINYSMTFFSIEIVDNNSTLIGVIESDIPNMTVSSNISAELSSINKMRIRYGLGGIKSTGIKGLNLIIAERKRNGKFKDLNDFLKRTAANGFNKRLFEHLVKSGAIEELYPNGSELILNIDVINQYVGNLSKASDGQIKQMSLLDLIDTTIVDEMPELKPTQIWSKTDKLQFEYAALGFYLTEHPVIAFSEILRQHQIMFSYEINQYHDAESREISIAGVVRECKIRSGKGENAGKYAFLTIVDPYGMIDVSIFDSRILNNQVKLLDDGQLVFCTAIIRNDARGQRILLRSIKSFIEAIEEFVPAFKVFIHTSEAAELIYQKIQLELVKLNRHLHITLVALCPDKSEVHFISNTEFNVTHNFIQEITNIPGIDIMSKVH